MNKKLLGEILEATNTINKIAGIPTGTLAQDIPELVALSGAYQFFTDYGLWIGKTFTPEQEKAMGKIEAKVTEILKRWDADFHVYVSASFNWSGGYAIVLHHPDFANFERGNLRIPNTYRTPKWLRELAKKS